MQTLSPVSQVTLYVLVTLIGLYALLLLIWQARVLRGESMRNPDGSADDWHEQKMLYGTALADVFVACPASLAGVVLLLLAPRWAHLVLAMVSFWFVCSNVATTATSLRFEKPRITLAWILVFPSGALLGLAYLAWAAVHVDVVFRS